MCEFFVTFVTRIVSARFNLTKTVTKIIKNCYHFVTFVTGHG